MEMDIVGRVKAIFYEQIKDIVENPKVELDDKLETVGINSISFVKFAIVLEEEFAIEFDPEEINLNRFQTLRDVINYLNEEIQKNKK